ncbi:MinD/ParA family ATP-binding protein [Actinomadura bangladeshensis]|uniref:MinD/ParA family ATP-binding protein n=1 Tax=Actinomadura bangladeshensis TaxID=453573 RepID=UPI0031E05E41
MARNEHDGRSLEERLASLDAMNEDTAEPPPEGAKAPPPGPAEQENAPPPPPPLPGSPQAPENNPWLAAPPAFQGGPEGFGPPQPPPYEGGPMPPPPYEGGPMPQPFDGGMLPPPYYPAPVYDPSQPPQPPQPAPEPPQGPQQSPYDANGNAAPPFDQLPPYPSDQYAQQDASGQYQPIDPATGQPYPQDTDESGQPYVPIDPNTGRPLAPDAGAPQFPPMDPNAGPQPFPPADPNAGPQPFPPADPNAGAPQFPPMDPNAGAQPYPPMDPNAGRPYPPDANGAPPQFPPAPPADPNAGRPYPQYQPIDPNTGQPYPQDPNAAAQPYQQIDPNTGQPYVPIDPNTGQPYQGYGYPAGGPHGQMAPQGQPAPPQEPQNTDSLSSENLLGERRIAPSSGWRRAIYKATAGNVHPGESQGELRRKDLIGRARTPVAGGHHRVAVMSLKGGVGKTTTTTGLGSMLGSFRGDRVIAVDANPDRGTLSDKVRLETAATVRDLLNNRDQIHRYADVRAFTSQNEARLEILASDRDPAVSEAFSAEDYAAVAVVLEQYYSVCITDCGTGLLHSAMAGVLSLADQLVLVSSPSVDGARSASATLDWLEAHDHGHLVRNGVVVLSMVRNRTRSQVDLDKLQAHFESRCRAVVRIPYDDHLEEGAEVELEQLAPATREAYLTLAAVVGDGFAFQRPQ